MKFKTPFKVLTTAALIGTLSLSAVAPGAASAAEKTTQVSQKEAQENFSLDKVVLTKGDSKITISFTEYALYAGSDKLNGYELAFVTAKNGDIFSKTDYALYFKAGDTPAQVIERLSEADKAKTVEGIEEGTFDTEDGNLAPVTGEQAVEAAKADLAKAVEAAAATDIKDAAAKAELAKAIEAAKAAAAKEDATKEELEAAKADLAKAVEAAKKADAEAALEAKVESVTAINASQVEVKFSKAVDETTATEAANYKIDGAVANATATLSKDGKTVTLDFNTALVIDSKEKTVALTIDGITLENDATKSIEKYSNVLKVKDATSASIEKVTAVTNDDTFNSVTIDYSEKVQAGSVIKIDGVKVGETTATKSQTIALDTSLDATKEHTVEIVNLKDTANNVEAVATAKFTATEDKVAPEVKSVTAQSDNKFVVEFSEKVTDLEEADFKLVDAATLDTITATDVSPVAGDETETKYVVTTDLVKADYKDVSEIKVNIAVAAKAFTDLAGNENKAVSTSVTLAKDTVAPKFVSLAKTLNSDGEVEALVYTFDKDIKATDLTTLANVEVITSEGATKAASALFNAVAPEDISGKTFTLNLNTPLKVGEYSITLPAGFVTDDSTSENKSSKVAQVVKFGDAESATEFTIVGAQGTVAAHVNTITVDFGTEVVGGAYEGSATDAARYTLNGKALPEDAKIVLSADLKKAIITLPVGTIATTDEAAILKVNDVKSKTGLTNKAFTSTVAVEDNVAPTLKSAKVLSDGKTFTLTYDEALSPTLVGAELKTGFTFTEGGQEVTVENVTVKSVSGKDLVVEAGLPVDAIEAEADGFYEADGTPYTPVKGDEITGKAIYFEEGDEVVAATGDGSGNDSSNVAQVLANADGFYKADGTSYTPVKDDEITGKAIYFEEGDEVVAATTKGFNTSKAITIETLEAGVKDVAENVQKAEEKVTVTK